MSKRCETCKDRRKVWAGNWIVGGLYIASYEKDCPECRPKEKDDE